MKIRVRKQVLWNGVMYHGDVMDGEYWTYAMVSIKAEPSDTEEMLVEEVINRVRQGQETVVKEVEV